jgi:TPR repeat protein
MTDDLKGLKRAAEAGNAAAQFNLAILCDSREDDNGYAVPGDRAEALRWLLEAARGGLPRAQLKLAEFYAEGRKVSGDLVRACVWFLVAMAKLNGAERARAEIGYRALAGRLTAGQMVKARRLAETWLKPAAASRKSRAADAGAALVPPNPISPRPQSA